MNNEKFSQEQAEMLKQLKSIHSKKALLQSIPDDMKKRLDEVMNNESELQRILNSERAKALYDLIKEDKE